MQAILTISAVQVSEGATDWEVSHQLHQQLLGLDPSLAESLRSLQLSPRITIVCLMHHMAAVALEESTHLPGQAINSWHDSASKAA